MSSRKLRVVERWFRRGLWAVAVLFSFFLAGLGGLIVQDLPNVAEGPSYQTILEQTSEPYFRAEEKKLRAEQSQNLLALKKARLELDRNKEVTHQAEMSMDAESGSRVATGDSEQNQKVQKATERLNNALAAQNEIQERLSDLENQNLEISEKIDQNQKEINQTVSVALSRFHSVKNWSELRVFSIRLCITLPILLLAVWLFVKKRKSIYWPFIWGYIFFALYAFFLELLPYLPTYGGYSYYLVGIVLTVLLGKYGVEGLSKYLEQKREEERNAPQMEESVDPVEAYTKVLQKICPRCDRIQSEAGEGQGQESNFCPFCGLEKYIHCQTCDTRINAFSRYCVSCGHKPQSSKEKIETQILKGPPPLEPYL